jgi:hypothetical protein
MMSSIFTRSLNFLVYNAPSKSTLETNTKNICNESYFSSTCEFLVGINEEYNYNTKVLYKSIIESDNDESVITESFDDFFNKAKEIIDKVIEFIKSLIKRFITSLNKLISSEGYIKKHKNDFDKFNNKDEFTFTGYNYTFSPDIPSINALESFNSEFLFGDRDALDKIRDSITKANSSHDTKDVIDSISEYYKTLIDDLEDGYYDKFRGKVLNKDDMIDVGNYPNELFTEYRNGTSDMEDITVNSSYVKSAKDRFLDHNKTIQEVKKLQKRVEEEYRLLQKSINEMQKTNYSNGSQSIAIAFPGDDSPTNVTYSSDLVNTINTWCKAKVNQVQEITNIHSLAFSAKLDAINGCFKQDKSVLYKALDYIQRPVKEEFEGLSAFDKDEQPAIKLSDSLLCYKKTDTLYEDPLEDDDVNEKEPARISQFSSLLKDLKLK